MMQQIWLRHMAQLAAAYDAAAYRAAKSSCGIWRSGISRSKIWLRHMAQRHIVQLSLAAAHGAAKSGCGTWRSGIWCSRGIW